MIKVCHITSAHQRTDGRIFRKECTSLAKAGYDVTLLVADGKPNEICNGVKIMSADCQSKNRLDRFLNSHKKLLNKALEINADIYQIHDPELLLMCRKLKKHGKKIIFDSHEFYPELISAKEYLGCFAKVVAYVYKVYETYVLRSFCDAVIVPCTKNGGVNVFEGRCKKTGFVSTAPLLSDFYDKYSGCKNKGNVVCHVGTLSYDRGISHLVKAAYKANVKLILAGQISNSYLHELQKMPEYSCVDYRGYVTVEDVFKIYAESAAGVATLLNVGENYCGDNFATKVYEYMSVGLPVIANDTAYVSKQNAKYHFGIIVNPEDIGEISDAISYIIGHPDEAKQMGKNGRIAIKEEFNWSIEEKKLLKLYEDIVK